MVNNIEAIVQHISENPAPVLLIDTCSLLDIIRVPHRANIHISHLEGAKNLLRVQHHLVVTKTVEIEYMHHLTPTCIELERYVLKFASNGERIINALESMDLDYQFYISNIEKLDLVQKLKSISDGILNKALIIEKDSQCIDKANTRTELYQAPARRNKSESKDCVIIEHYLKLAKLLQQNTFSKKIVFITSNSNDYGSAPNPKPPLDTEFVAQNVFYCNNFKWALSQAI